MVNSALIDAEKFDEITELTREAVRNMLGFHLKHIGINSADENEAASIAESLSDVFGFESRETDISFFCGDEIEVMKSAGNGTMGHIAIGCNSVDRAVYHLGSQGVEFDMDTALYTEKGALKFIYVKGEYGGFALHLTLND